MVHYVHPFSWCGAQLVWDLGINLITKNGFKSSSNAQLMDVYDWVSHISVYRTHSEHYNGIVCSFSVIMAHYELVYRLNWPNAHSHPTDLSVLIRPEDTASVLVWVPHLCQQFWLERAFDLRKLILPNQVLQCSTEPAERPISSLCLVSCPSSFSLTLSTPWGRKVYLCKVWAKVLRSVSRAREDPLWTRCEQKGEQTLLADIYVPNSGTGETRAASGVSPLVLS